MCLRREAHAPRLKGRTATGPILDADAHSAAPRHNLWAQDSRQEKKDHTGIVEKKQENDIVCRYSEVLLP